MYNKKVLKEALRALVIEFDELNLLGGIEPDYLRAKISEHLHSLIASHLNQNEQQILILENSSSPLISIITDALIQPSLIHISSKCDKEYLDGWELFPCPICGQNPSIVVKTRAEIWRFKCSYCLTEYKMDIFSCPVCNKQGHENKDFLIVGENQEYEIASCKECSHYFKIINRERTNEIPDGLEDLYTHFLDEIATEQNLVRIDND
jgi:formate dehydrogenase maturation protein FdhE